MKKSFLIATTIIFGVLLFTFVVVYALSGREDVSPTQTPALINGNPETGYPNSGYMVGITDTEQKLCGITFLSQYVGLTAAHCLDEVNTVYANTGEFQEETITDPEVGFESTNFAVHPDYDPTNFINDIAFVLFDEGPTINGGYARIETATVSCGYYLVAYGQSVVGDPTSSTNRLGADMCIDEIDTLTKTLTGSFDGQSSCFGDSGSSVYEKDSNRIIGLVSFAEGAGNNFDCTSDAVFLTDFDAFGDFIAEYEDWTPNNVTTPTPTLAITNTPTPTAETTPTTVLTPSPTVIQSSSPTPTQSLTPTITPTVEVIPITSSSNDSRFKLIIGITILVIGLYLAAKISNSLGASDDIL